MEKSQEQVAAELTEPQTLDYKGRTTNVNGDGELDVTFQADVDRMLNHPVVAEAVRVNESGLASAEFEILDASNSEVGNWAAKALAKFWENDLHTVQLSYRPGWVGAEILYREEGAELTQCGLKPFHPADVRPLKWGEDYAGVRVRQLREKGETDLRCAGRWPGRAFWHGHDCTYLRFYGNSMLRAAHRDWQRLAEQRGTEEMMDIAITRTGVPGPEYRYDDEAQIVRNADGSLSYDKAREKARQVIEQCLSGMAMILSSKRDKDGNYKEELKWPTTVLNLDPMLSLVKHYESRICYAIGTPRELMESVETGGWAGRNITMETFLATQQRYGRLIANSWFQQIGLPLCQFHHGPEAYFSLRMIPLNKSRQDQAGGEPGPNRGPMGQQQPIGNAPPPNRAYGLPERGQARLMSTSPPSRRIKTSPIWMGR